MIKSLRIQNFKSIVDDTIELGRINVFIGENGCGKSNILEAMAMMSASFDNNLDNEGLYSKGIRVAKPTLMRNEFLSDRKKDTIQIRCTITINDIDYPVASTITAKEDNLVFTDWESQNNIPELLPFITNYGTTASPSDIIKLLHGFETLKKILDISPIDRIINQTEGIIPTESIYQKENKLEKQALQSLNTLREVLSTSPKKNIDSRIPAILQEYEKTLNTLYKVLTTSPKKNTDSIVPAILKEYLIYNLSTKALRGIYSESRKTPLGVNGENLDILISTFDKSDLNKLKDALKVISWFSDIIIDLEDILKFAGHKLGKSTSTLYFKDKFMKRKNNIFSAENANEGILHILFYLTLFISKRTPEFFAIDNIETALNPQLCRNLIKKLAELAKEHNKQALITTHNPAVLDGLNLHDDEQRLFVVYRNDKGHTQTRRVTVKPDFDNNRYKLSELWMRGQLGGLPQTF